MYCMCACTQFAAKYHQAIQENRAREQKVHLLVQERSQCLKTSRNLQPICLKVNGTLPLSSLRSYQKKLLFLSYYFFPENLIWITTRWFYNFLLEEAKSISNYRDELRSFSTEVIAAKLKNSRSNSSPIPLVECHQLIHRHCSTIIPQLLPVIFFIFNSDMTAIIQTHTWKSGLISLCVGIVQGDLLSVIKSSFSTLSSTYMWKCFRRIIANMGTSFSPQTSNFNVAGCRWH